MRLTLLNSLILIVLSASPVSAEWTFIYEGEHTSMIEGKPETAKTVKENYFADLSSIKTGSNSVWVMGVYEPPDLIPNFAAITKWKELWTLNCQSLSYQPVRGILYSVRLYSGSSPVEEANVYADEKKTFYPEPDNELHTVLNILCKAS